LIHDWSKILPSEFVPYYKRCGEDTHEFLALDHIYGSGSEHRRMIGKNAGLPTYRWAANNGFPPLFRVLCHNCNMAMAYFGRCPHQDKKEKE
jgi:hypothetical protein